MSDDNAFVDVHEALRGSKRAREDKDDSSDARRHGVAGDDDDFLGNHRSTSRWAARSHSMLQRGGATGSHNDVPSFPKRITTLHKVLSQQHAKYLEELQEWHSQQREALADELLPTPPPPQSQPSAGRKRREDVPSKATSVAVAPATNPCGGALEPLQVECATLDAWLVVQDAWDKGKSVGSLWPPSPSFLSMMAPPTSQPTLAGNRLCSVCLMPGSLYTCTRCKTSRFCCVECHDIHDETRCLKFVV